MQRPFPIPAIATSQRARLSSAIARILAGARARKAQASADPTAADASAAPPGPATPAAPPTPTETPAIEWALQLMG